MREGCRKRDESKRAREHTGRKYRGGRGGHHRPSSVLACLPTISYLYPFTITQTIKSLYGMSQSELYFSSRGLPPQLRPTLVAINGILLETHPEVWERLDGVRDRCSEKGLSLTVGD